MEKNALSAYLKMARKNAGYQQEEIATQLGITRATYSHYENSRIVPPTEALYKLSEIYHVPVDHLMKLSITKQEDSSAPEEEKNAASSTGNDDISDDIDALYSGFLNKCSKMSNDELNRWVTVEDRELIYYYHKLNARDKRIVNSFMKSIVLMKKFD